MSANVFEFSVFIAALFYSVSPTHFHAVSNSSLFLWCIRFFLGCKMWSDNWCTYVEGKRLIFNICCTFVLSLQIIVSEQSLLYQRFIDLPKQLWACESRDFWQSSVWNSETPKQTVWGEKSCDSGGNGWNSIQSYVLFIGLVGTDRLLHQRLTCTWIHVALCCAVAGKGNIPSPIPVLSLLLSCSFLA